MPCLGASRPVSCSTRENAPRSSASVDRLRRGAEHRHAGVLQPLRQTQRRLPAEGADDAGHRAGRALGLDHLEDVLEGQRLEVEPVGGVVVGGDGLGVAVDHHRLVAGVLQRHDGVHAGVVELDALPDPVGPRPEDQHRLPSRAARPRSPRRRWSSGTACGRRTRRRRCRRSCRPAGCRAGGAAVRTPSSPASSGRSAAICRSDSPCRLARRSSAAVSAGASRTSLADLAHQRDLVDEPGVVAAGRRDLLDGGAGGQRPLGEVQPAVDRRPQRLEQLVGGPVVVPCRSRTRRPPSPWTACALPSASVKLRPRAMASPTLFIVVVSRGSAPGNFSNANRGIFTTT